MKKPKQFAGGDGNPAKLPHGGVIVRGSAFGAYLDYRGICKDSCGDLFLDDSVMDFICNWWQNKPKEDETMKPDKIAIRVHNEHLSRAIQEMAKESGYEEEFIESSLDYEFLDFNPKSKEMDWGNNREYFEGKSYKILDALTDMAEIVAFFKAGKPQPPFMEICGRIIRTWCESGFVLDRGEPVAWTKIEQAYNYIKKLREEDC